MIISSRFFPYVIGFFGVVILLCTQFSVELMGVQNGVILCLSIFPLLGLYFFGYGWFLIFKRFVRKTRSVSKREAILRYVLASGAIAGLFNPLLFEPYSFALDDLNPLFNEMSESQSLLSGFNLAFYAVVIVNSFISLVSGWIVGWFVGVLRFSNFKAERAFGFFLGFVLFLMSSVFAVAFSGLQAGLRRYYEDEKIQNVQALFLLSLCVVLLFGLVAVAKRLIQLKNQKQPLFKWGERPPMLFFFRNAFWFQVVLIVFAFSLFTFSGETARILKNTLFKQDSFDFRVLVLLSFASSVVAVIFTWVVLGLRKRRLAKSPLQ